MTSKHVEKFALRKRADEKARNSKEFARSSDILMRDYKSRASATLRDMNPDDSGAESGT